MRQKTISHGATKTQREEKKKWYILGKQELQEGKELDRITG